MAIHVAIEHSTSYRYDRTVSLSPHVIRLRPAPHARTPIHDYRLDITPADHRLYWQQDPFGNTIARVVFPGKVDELKIDVRLVAEMTVINPFDFYVEKYAEHFPFQYEPLLKRELEPYFELTESGPKLMAWLEKVDRRKMRIVDFLVAINQRLKDDIDYTIRFDPGVQTGEETLTKALGSCRDTGWLLVQILRHMGLAARFVSGYLIQLTADQKSLDGPSGPEEDFTDLHAWAEVFIPGAGWIGLDPTSGLFAGEGHIPLACTPDPVSAAPLTGASDKCEVEFGYANVVKRVLEDPRVTKPYTEAQWADIQHLGHQVDAELRALDTRLTMGGEPTFVSVDDMEGPEWNTEALGADKRRRAGVLLKRLRAAFGPGALLHFGQGKWYPGEPLPRWALGCFWRTDGQALWKDEKLIADAERDYGVGPEQARTFAERLTERLGIDPRYLVNGYEDWVYYLWREANQPVNLDPIAIPWAPQFRDDLSLVLARGLDQPVGLALPLLWDYAAAGWRSGLWRFAREQMYLTPGGSPMGLRLPTHELPWAVEVEQEVLISAPSPQRSPNVGALPSARPAPASPAPDVRAPLAADERPEVIRQRYRTWEGIPHTALCIEPRGGCLHLFMPPLNTLWHYANLLEAIEATAAELGLPVLIEGYEPPGSPELKVLKVTPDPGVIEVNIHPASSWEDLEHNTVTLYEEARLSRLATEKFMLDGRHTGTGGGNHVTLGGPTPQDSPFLRRPDLLRSLVTYWQHHPSLSYLFSGTFIGPTSQAPRPDERGSRLLAELDVSLREIEHIAAPWLLDRALRNFLVDGTGNTHRAEFSIDKLYSPDSASGRQGLLEFRAFEMPPHARMSLAQMLLLRAMVAYFWREPYRHSPVPWGTSLHDRFLLPHYVWSDFGTVIEQLKRAGYPFDLAWFEAFLEFRFPVCGRVHYAGVELELRTALEPWLVLGEDATAHRQARVVDSAVERLQVRCRNLDPERFLVTCNRRRLPLQATANTGDYVAGVRFKAWKAAFGLHPTVEVHAPLVFDIFDRQLGRSVGGCVYHVAHPGGRAYDTFPVNAYEAESRRVSRFWDCGHTAGDAAPPPWVQGLSGFHEGELAAAGYEPPPEPSNPDYPCTLDLRRLGAS
ncbi:transglutaminase family protein [Methylotetracoccus oryzae]|uniref:transglutaminase family protein n=1 Tax=Methylotetracoccus oryzae TaxID=1919059 RepID=UPI001118BD7C|nr:transglutaminase family protein [Methylotetracoccus oryzae]